MIKFKKILQISGIFAISLAAAACSKNGAADNLSSQESVEKQDLRSESVQTKSDATDGKKLSGTENDKADIYVQKLTPITVIHSKKTEQSPESKSLRLSYYCGLKVEDKGYDELNKIFAKLEAENKNELYKYIEHNRDKYAVDKDSEQGAESFDYEGEINLSIKIKRADDIAVSFLEETYEDFGGAHPLNANKSRNFNSKTGDEIKTDDVITDRTKFYETLIRLIEDDERSADFFDDYKKIIKDEIENDSLTWVLLDRGIQVILDPYEVASYAVGQIDIDIDANENPELFKKGFFTDKKSYTKYLKPGYKETLRLSSENEAISVGYDIETNENTDGSNKNYDKITIDIGDGDLEPKTYDLSGFYNFEKDSSAVLHTEEGGSWLYVNSEAEGSNLKVDIFKLTPKDSEFVGSYDGAIWDYLSSPDDFIIYNTENIFGNHIVYRHYFINDKGLPETEDKAYTYAYYEGLDNMMLRSSMKAFELNELDDTVGLEVMLEKGTVFSCVKTDLESYCDIKTNDGKFYRVNITVKGNNIKANDILQEKLMLQQNADSDNYDPIKGGL